MFKRKTWHLDHEDDESASESDTGSETSSSPSSGSDGGVREETRRNPGRKTSTLGRHGGGFRNDCERESSEEETSGSGACTWSKRRDRTRANEKKIERS